MIKREQNEHSMSEQTLVGATRGRPKDPAKRLAILEAAKELFLTHGFSGTSMDAVAAEAGVSKLTVYNHFSDKETLFSAAIEAKCESQMPLPMFSLDEGGDVAKTLQQIGEAFLEMIYSEDSTRLMRLISAIGASDPQMAQLFYDAGPQRTRNEMAKFLARANELGMLRVPDCERAAEIYFGMLQGGCRHFQHILGCCEVHESADNREYVADVVRVFMRGYGV